ncbi:unnamed protein product [Polarella glacialis]|uniref:Uncharacterized protein n=1 Tax=Polarella glacialis TaxID=89957 RepID=A0A813IQH3_POLGL|nr:unnamed protein product [Polarella glacialis]
MPPKAKAQGKAKANALPKRRYRSRVSVPAPAPLRARNEQSQNALRQRPGSWRLCPDCTYPRYVPTAASSNYSCTMPRVRLPNGEWFHCVFRTTASAWRRQKHSTLEHEAACKAVIHELVNIIEARCAAGDLAEAEYYPALRREMAARTAAPAADMQPSGFVCVDLFAPVG